MKYLAKILLTSLAMLWGMPSSADAANLKKHEILSQRFLRTVKLPVKSKAQVQHILYGNDLYGYYSLNLFKRKAGNLVFQFVPPGYKKPIEFYIGLQRGKSIKYLKAGKKSYRSPVPKAYRKSIGSLKKGQFTSPYFLLGGALPKQKLVDPNFKTKDQDIFKKDKYRYTFVQILNRQGEVVWIHVPTQNSTILSSYLQAKPIGSGKFGVLFGKKAGYFEVVDYKGRVQQQINSRFANSPFTMHHDFTMIAPNKIVTISNRSGKVRARDLRAKGMQTFLTDVLVEINLNTQKKVKRLDFASLFKPGKTDYFTGDKDDDKKFVLWGEPKADFEFTHVNSIDFYPGRGYLVSIRNLNKIVMLDTSLSKVLWSLGPDKDDTFHIKNPNDQFTHQHTPTLLTNGNLMLFNNGRTKKRSRIMVYKLNRKNGEAKAVWTYTPDPPLFSKNRSSVFPMKNGNTLAYFVSPISKGQSVPPRPNVDHMIEIDRYGKEVAYMTREFEVLSPGYRATPLESIGVERFVGSTLKEAQGK